MIRGFCPVCTQKTNSSCLRGEASLGCYPGTPFPSALLRLLLIPLPTCCQLGELLHVLYKAGESPRASLLLISGPSALWPVRLQPGEPVPRVYPRCFKSLSQGRALGAESTPHSNKAAPLLCVAGIPPSMARNPQPVLPVLVSPRLQMVRDGRRRRKRCARLKGNVIPARSPSPSSEAASGSLCWWRGVRGGGSCSTPPGHRCLGKVNPQPCPGVQLGIPVGDSAAGGLSSRFHNSLPVLSASSTSSNPLGQQDHGGVGGGSPIPALAAGISRRLGHFFLVLLAAQAQNPSPVVRFPRAWHRAGEIFPCSWEGDAGAVHSGNRR